MMPCYRNVILAVLIAFQRMTVTYRSRGRINYARMRCRTWAQNALGCEVQTEMYDVVDDIY